MIRSIKDTWTTLDSFEEETLFEEAVHIEDLILLIREVTYPVLIKATTEIPQIKIEYPKKRKKIDLIGYKNQLGQVIFNLVWNSFQAIQQKKENKIGIIKIEVNEEKSENSVDGQAIMIQITDNGIGISKEYLQPSEGFKKGKIFKKGITTKKKLGGKGLGLYLCRKIIEDYHLGDIRIVSEYGNWTKVIIKIPRV